MASHPNTGGLWKNKNRTHPKSPNFTGQIDIECTVYYISGWRTDGKGGKPLVSIRVNQKALADVTHPQPTEKDDDVPF